MAMAVPLNAFCKFANATEAAVVTITCYTSSPGLAAFGRRPGGQIFAYIAVCTVEFQING